MQNTEAILLTAFVAGICGIAAALVAQLVPHSRARNELLTKKIEEFLSLNAEMIDIQLKLFIVTAYPQSETGLNAMAAQELRNKQLLARLNGSTLVTLYIPRLSHHWSQVVKLYNPLEQTRTVNIPAIGESPTQSKVADIEREVLARHVSIFESMQDITYSNLDRMTERFMSLRYKHVGRHRDTFFEEYPGKGATLSKPPR